MLALDSPPISPTLAASSIPNVETTSVTFTTSGTWTAPAGVTSVIVEVWGGGGRGATIIRYPCGGGGGGGGAYSKKSGIPVTSGISYSVVVGSGSVSFLPGGDSYFINTSTVLAKGGKSALDNSQTGNYGGAAASGIGDIKYSGGKGAENNGWYGDQGGGGGSSAGTDADGTNATNYQGAVAPIGGGNGGSGGDWWTGSDGQPGSTPGGGGGGAISAGYDTRIGGSGANGKVVITYSATPPTRVYLPLIVR